MRISGGISEFMLPSRIQQSQQAKKMFVWPVYGEGRVNSIHGITRRISPDIVYAKPVPEDHLKLMGMKESRESLYSSSGGFTVRNTSHLQPGSFFDAMA